MSLEPCLYIKGSGDPLIISETSITAHNYPLLSLQLHSTTSNNQSFITHLLTLFILLNTIVSTTTPTTEATTATTPLPAAATSLPDSPASPTGSFIDPTDDIELISYAGSETEKENGEDAPQQDPPSTTVSGSLNDQNQDLAQFIVELPSSNINVNLLPVNPPPPTHHIPAEDQRSSRSRSRHSSPSGSHRDSSYRSSRQVSPSNYGINDLHHRNEGRARNSAPYPRPLSPPLLPPVRNTVRNVRGLQFAQRRRIAEFEEALHIECSLRGVVLADLTPLQREVLSREVRHNREQANRYQSRRAREENRFNAKIESYHFNRRREDRH